jgi:hypothetical protein
VDGIPITIPYEIRVLAGDRPQPSGGKLLTKELINRLEFFMFCQVVHPE